MVVFGHITSLGNPIDLWFAAYKIPIFFIVSGYLLCMRQSFRKMSASQYIWKHFKSLMIPYFGYSAIVMLYNMLVCLMKGTGRAQMYSKFVYQAYTTLSLRGISALWFCRLCFCAGDLYPGNESKEQFCADRQRNPVCGYHGVHFRHSASNAEGHAHRKTVQNRVISHPGSE